MEMSERKRLILNAIVSEYINTAEPVGSASIAKKYDAGCSTATIRNEMAELEEWGYLDKPHTSAGRIPSVRGYRFYVNSMAPYALKEQERRRMQEEFLEQMRDMENLIVAASDFISRMTNYTVIASDCFEDNPLKCVYTGGVGKIFDHPEYKNLERAKRLISFMDKRDSLYRMISGFPENGVVRITIGDENTDEDLKDSSVVIANYYNRDGRCGGLGIIGPTRMHYQKVVASLGMVTEMLHFLIDKRRDE
ncbi:MAG: hypothetical protein PUB07_05580 [Clostridia bacterium]|nr:hypothetical protein [Clostridia bacterium]